MSGSRWYALAVLTVVGTMNWADRQVVPILFPGIREELGLSDTQLGVIGGLAFSLIYAISALFFGYAADRYLRKRIILFGLLVWSAATAAGGLAQGFWSLFAARFFTGIGEASLYPCVMSIIGERFAADERGRALGIFGACAALGSGLGIGLGGVLAESIGWRQVFFLYGGVGVLLVPLLMSVPEARREVSRDPAEETLRVVRELFGDRRLRWIWLTGTVAIACGQGFGAWAPSYFERQLGFGVAEAGILFGAGGLLGGIVGGIAGGTAADRMRRKRVGGEFEVIGAAALAGCLLLVLTLESGTGAVAVAAAAGLAATFAIYGIFPGIGSAILALVPEKRHGVTGAVNAILLGGIGAATGPFVVGALSDATGSLHDALFAPTLGLSAVAVLALLTRGLVRRAALRSPSS